MKIFQNKNKHISIGLTPGESIWFEIIDKQTKNKEREYFIFTMTKGQAKKLAQRLNAFAEMMPQNHKQKMRSK